MFENHIFSLSAKWRKKKTNKEITQIIRQILREFKIDPKKVTHIVTDGGSAFCKAFKLFGKSVDTLVEPNESSDDNMGEDNIPFIVSDSGDQFYSNILNLDATEANYGNIDSERNENVDELDIMLNNHQIGELENDLDQVHSDEDDEIILSSELNDKYETQPLPAHRRCLSRLLNLLGNDFENALTGRAKSCLVMALNKLQALWVFPRKSSQAKVYCKEILGCSLLIPCATRWNSKFDAVSKILNIGQDKINQYIDVLKTNLTSSAYLTKLDEEDWVMVNLYVKVMKPIATTLDRLQGEIECSQGFILPSLFTVKHMLNSLQGGAILKACRDTMLQLFEKRFSAYFRIDSSNKELLVASMTVPRFKIDFIESEVFYIVAKEILISEIKQMQTNSNVIQHETNGIEPNDFFVSFATRRGTRSRSFELTVEDELNRYLQDARKDLPSLHDYPNIKELFFKHNTNLPSSAAVERVFSQSNLIFTPRRNRLSSTNFERLLFLKYNQNSFNVN